MDELKNWLISVIISVLCATVVYLMSPNSSVKRALKTVVSLFILCALFSPFFSGVKLDISENILDFQGQSSQLNVQIQDEMVSVMELDVQTKINEYLKTLKINDAKIKVLIDKDKTNLLYVKSIELTLSKEYKEHQEEICKELISKFNVSGEYKWI